jgi:Tfp pilus assembly protein PilV
MKHYFSKQRAGLSLIEVIFALVFVAVAIPGMLRLQTVLSRGVHTAYAFTSRIAHMRNIFAQAERERWYTQDQTKEIKIDDPQTVLQYKREKLPESSTLKNVKNMYTERVEATWTDRFGKRTEQLATLRFYPEGPETAEDKSG